jgi:hypothetical protein
MLTRMTALTLDRRVILVYEVALDELDGQTRFSYTATAYYDELVLSEELERESVGPKEGWRESLLLMPLCVRSIDVYRFGRDERDGSTASSAGAGG